MKAVSCTSTMVVAAVLLVAVLVAEVQAAKGGPTCKPHKLVNACLPDFREGGPPSKNCCKHIYAQSSCICGYLKRSSLGKYFELPGVVKTFGFCHNSFPICPANHGPTCKPHKLVSACLQDFKKGGVPSKNCCKHIHAQSSCICGYLKRSSLGKYFELPGVVKTFGFCHNSFPICT